MRRGVRSTTGCAECRARHVKCDETKPVCMRCSKRKSTCIYGMKLEWRQDVARDRRSSVHRQAKPHQNRPVLDDTPNGSTAVQDLGFEVCELPDLTAFSTMFSGIARWDQQNGSLLTSGRDAPTVHSEHQSSAVNLSSRYGEQIRGPLTEYLTPLLNFTQTSMDVDRSTLLMNFYFEKVAPIFSCYDGGKNPFHHLITQVWHSDSRDTEYDTLIGAIQGLAAVFIATYDPSMQAEALSLQRRTQEQLENVPEALRHCSKHLFALVLLGISWMYSHDFSASFNSLKQLRAILQSEAALSQLKTSRLDSRELRFFWGLQIHCEIQHTQDDAANNISPHPFTGVASSISATFLEVMQLIKRQRDSAKSHAFASRRHIEELENLMAEASELEQRVFLQRVPDPDSIRDPEDPTTPIQHLTKMAACQRDTSLLQLRRVFPDLAAQRSSTDADFAETQDHTSMEAVVDKHCLSMALGILDRLAAIPETSGTTPFQTILLLSTSSELRLSRIMNTTTSINQAELEASLTMDAKVIEAREFVINRLTTSQGPIPGGRLIRLLDTVRKIWYLLDDDHGSETVYWFDIIT